MDQSLFIRIADFLKLYPPFDQLADSVLLEIVRRVKVVYKELKEHIFEQEEATHDYIYVVREGAVDLYRMEGQQEILVDTCDEGDLFGIRPLLDQQTYALSAKAAEPTLLYAIGINGLNAFLEEHPGMAVYLAKSFAAGIRKNYEMPEQRSKDAKISLDDSLLELQTFSQNKAPVYCPANISIQDAAQVMRREKVSSIIIADENKHPIGILTDKDLRNKVATGMITVDKSISEVMSSPVITIPKNLTVAEVQMMMIKNKIHHLIITEDGSNQSPITGVLTEHDLLVTQANNPAVLMRNIKHANSTAVLKKVRDKAETLLKKYLEQEVSIHFIAEIMSSINDAIIDKVVQMSIRELSVEAKLLPEVRFCWLTLGSEGREEQLLRTDQDNALVYEDVGADQNEGIKNYFLALAKRVTHHLHTCSFEYCPADMMASNPQWCLSLTEWKQQFSKWLLEPDKDAILMSSIFFDFRPVYGALELAEELSTHIFTNIDQRTPFLNFLAKDAIQNPPPLSFFRKFVVEKNGKHAQAFDIKARAMMPLTDAARLLILAAKEGGINNTFKRFERLAALEPQHGELFEQAADAYELLMRYRAKYGLVNQDSGRYINPDQLSKMERLNLRNSFRPISELQTLISTRYRLAFIM